MTTSNPTPYTVLTTTADSEDKAGELADRVIGERLAACAQVYPVRSVYRWEGKVERAQEWRIDFKTRGDLIPELTARIAELHDYDTPEIIAVPVLAGSPAYLDWIGEQTRYAGAS
ncbi:divalent cation tolerance protein [Streptomyces spiroverticillatus]|uniref:Divalent cation tolerance protein n=1 Tax=Streptomyces finlayi TaxID=67296 RepID=A0A918WWX4_9ACTN|nr:divalent-cation tolerance protein CutA [Streptomyces finlayi]GHA08063.1 divalent cation tolerance protein [Streptomyces spiroverticillatus]GHC91152.1 divalent cation tolerance protein [Streptomyces finlayi]